MEGGIDSQCTQPKVMLLKRNALDAIRICAIKGRAVMTKTLIWYVLVGIRKYILLHQKENRS